MSQPVGTINVQIYGPNKVPSLISKEYIYSKSQGQRLKVILRSVRNIYAQFELILVYGWRNLDQKKCYFTSNKVKANTFNLFQFLIFSNNASCDMTESHMKSQHYLFSVSYL